MRELIDELTVHTRINGVPIHFTRRNYGRGQFYCWVEAHVGGRWQSLGDPWPCSRPKTAEIVEELSRRDFVHDHRKTLLKEAE